MAKSNLFPTSMKNLGNGVKEIRLPPLFYDSIAEQDVSRRKALGLDSRRLWFLLILTHRFLLSNQGHNSQPPGPRVHAGLHKGLSGLETRDFELKIFPKESIQQNTYWHVWEKSSQTFKVTKKIVSQILKRIIKMFISCHYTLNFV